ncbi:MAG: hypothetical protein CMN76_01850 [Spirochaetaceae bacterium]|nr:hypothetical protein [Spirochaetaceae bacterium]|tara:strand:- start:21574 stop:21960 length:387 start_codon:yes stop_codon:yes gene_type:complete
MQRIVTSLFTLAISVAAIQSLVAEEPAAQPAPEPAETWKEGIVQEFPIQYDEYIPGFESGPSQSLEVEAGPVDTGEVEPPETTDGSDDSDFSISQWFADRNVINGLLLLGIIILFIIYQMRSGGKRRG